MLKRTFLIRLLGGVSALLLVVATAMTPTAVDAREYGGHGGGGRGWGWGWGLGLGVGLGLGIDALAGWPGYYYPPYGYPYAYPYAGYPGYAPVVPTTTVIQQAAPVAAAPQVWYYCNDPKGYYPYVPSCGSAWQPVPATPPAGAPAH